jgi:hypothetical protein
MITLYELENRKYMYRAVNKNKDQYTRWFVFVGDARRAGDKKFGVGNWILETKSNRPGDLEVNV